MPRLRTPARSISVSPSAASRMGLESRYARPPQAARERAPSADRLFGNEAQAVAVQKQKRERRQEERRLQHVAEIDRHAEGAARGQDTRVDQRQKQPAEEDTGSAQAAERRDDDAGIAVTGREFGDEVAVNPRDLPDAREPRDPAAQERTGEDRAAYPDAREPRRLAAEPDGPQLEPEARPGERSPEQRDQNEREGETEVNTGARDDFRQQGRRGQRRRARPAARRVAPRAVQERVDQKNHD